MAKSWLKIIQALKQMLAKTGPIWPESTKLSGYATRGPYFCGDCIHLRGREKENVFRDADGLGRCDHSVVIADSEVKKDKSGIPIVDIEHGCCEFVELVQIESEEK